MNESVDLNTQRMCSLQDSNERTAGSLQMLQIIFGGVLAFQILDRITGKDICIYICIYISVFI
jgi:hypothetical protein